MPVEKLRYVVTANTTQFTSAMKAVGVLVVATLAAAVKITAEFNKELSKLRGISGATGKDLSNLEAQARRLGASTAFTATQAVQLQVELAKLGFTTNEILNSSGGVLDLAGGLGISLADAAKLTGSTLRAFGIEAKDTGRVVDVLAKSTTISALDFEKLRESLKLVAPVASQLGYSLEDTTALLAKLADAGIHGSQAGTSLRQIMLELLKAGISLEDAFERVNFAFNSNTEALDLVKKRALPAFLVLKNGAIEVKKLGGDLEDATGFSKGLREEFEDNTWGDWKKLLSVLSDAAISLGKAVDGPLRKALQGITKWIQEGGLLKVLDLLWKGFLNLGIGVFEFGRAVDLVALAISKGPFGNSDLLGNSNILLRIAKATEALERFRKKIKEINEGKGFKAGGGEAPKENTEPEGTKQDLDNVDIFAKKLNFFQKVAQQYKRELKGIGLAIETFFNDFPDEALYNVFSSIGDAVARGVDPLKAAGNALLATLGGFLSELGKEAIKLGGLAKIFATTIKAIKKFLIANPALAFAAGAALVVAGAAFSSAASASQGRIGGSGSSGGSSGGGFTPSLAQPNIQSQQGAGFGGGIVGKISGNDILLVSTIASDRRQGVTGSSLSFG